jgi:hypothetical protein
VQDRGVEGREGESKGGRGGRRRLLCLSDGRIGDMTVYSGARPGTAN